MKFITVKTYEELSQKAADIIASQVILKPNCVLGLATGSSPVGTYKRLAEDNKNGKIDFSDVTTVNLDEYVGLDISNDQSYRYFMNDNLFNHINRYFDFFYYLYLFNNFNFFNNWYRYFFNLCNIMFYWYFNNLFYFN